MHSISERMMRTIIEHASAMLWCATLPVGFWSCATKCFVFLNNRSPASALSDSIIPYEAWHEFPPNLFTKFSTAVRPPMFLMRFALKLTGQQSLHLIAYLSGILKPRIYMNFGMLRLLWLCGSVTSFFGNTSSATRPYYLPPFLMVSPSSLPSLGG